MNAAHIGVAVNGGVVTLTGHVETLAVTHAAAEAVLRVHGVNAAAQDIEVRLGPETARTADDIAAATAWAAPGVTAVENEISIEERTPPVICCAKPF